MKKILSVLLLAAMMVSCVLPTMVSAEPGELSLSLAGPAEIKDTAKTVELKLNLDGNSESGVWGMSVFLAYTPGWTIASIENGNLWQDGEMETNTAPSAYSYAKALKNADINADDVEVALIHVEGGDSENVGNKVTANGTVATVTFNVPADAEVGDALNVQIAYDPADPMTFGEDGAPVSVEFANVVNYNAAIIATPVVAVENVKAKSGETVDVNVALRNVNGVKSVSVSNLTYDAAKLELVEAKWAVEAPIADWNAEDKTGVLTFDANTDINGAVLVLTFKVADEAEEGTIGVNANVAVTTKPAEGEEVALEVDYIGGAVVVANVLRGDVDGDGVFTEDDAIYLLNAKLLPDMFELNQDGDFDKNGEFNEDDAIYLLNAKLLPDMFPLN